MILRVFTFLVCFTCFLTQLDPAQSQERRAFSSGTELAVTNVQAGDVLNVRLQPNPEANVVAALSPGAGGFVATGKLSGTITVSGSKLALTD